MRCKFNIKARQTGKTTDLIKCALKQPKQKIAFIVVNNNMKNNVIQKINNVTNLLNFSTNVEFFTANEFINYLKQWNQFNTVLIDEYLSFTEYEQNVIYSYLQHHDSFIKIESTPKRLINPTLFYIVSSMREKGLSILEVSKHIKEDCHKELYYLWYNFLSDLKTVVKNNYQEKCSLLGDKFEIEYLGKLFE